MSMTVSRTIEKTFFSYSICFRQEEGYCCLQLLLCPFGTALPFSLDGSATTFGTSELDTDCEGDFVGISGKPFTIVLYRKYQ